MNRITTAILALTTTLLFVQCDTEESRKEKAEDLIKQDLFETLPDYKSYELVSLEMDSIEECWISIPGIIDLAKEYQQAFEDESNAKIRYNELLAQKEKLGKRAFNRYMAPDLFGLAKIGKEKKQLDNDIIAADSQWSEAADQAESLYGQLTGKIATGKSEDFVGWHVTHKFRTKNNEGVIQLYCSHYYISLDMKRIIIKWNDEEEEIPQLFNLMESVLDAIKNSEPSSAKQSNDKIEYRNNENESDYIRIESTVASFPYLDKITLDPQNGNSYAASNLFDRDPETAWAIGAKKFEKFERETEGHFPRMVGIKTIQQYPIERLVITNGYAKDKESWSNNARAKTIAIMGCTQGSNLADDLYSGTLSDTSEPQTVILQKTGQYDYYNLIIEDYYPGKKWNDVCISEIEVFGLP